MVYDGVPVTLIPSPTDPDAFTVHVDAGGLAWSYATETEPRHTEVILIVATFDKHDKQLTHAARAIKADAPDSVPATGRIERGLDLEYKIEHDPKAVRARFVVRVTASGRIGTADAVLGQTSKPAAPKS